VTANFVKGYAQTVVFAYFNIGKDELRGKKTKFERKRKKRYGKTHGHLYRVVPGGRLARIILRRKALDKLEAQRSI
jgi:hypothetical protein